MPPVPPGSYVYDQLPSQIKPNIVCLFVSLLCRCKNASLGPKIGFSMAEQQQHHRCGGSSFGLVLEVEFGWCCATMPFRARS